MENDSFPPEFHIVAFSSTKSLHLYLFTVFLLLYVTAVLANSVIITVIYMDKRLHTPMYLFLCNLSLIDLCYITVTVPNLLHMFLSGNFHMSFIQCFTQMYFNDGFGTTEIVVISIMAYDRYVAICEPLHYHRIFSRNNCLQFTVVIWISGFLNSILVTISASKLSFCHSYTIHRYFCDPKALLKISCNNIKQFFLITYIELFVIVVCPFFCTLMSYIKIISAILKTKSRDGRKKTFSTCSSHITVLTLFYVTGSLVYIIPMSDHYRVPDLILTVLYTAVTPMLNPLIYTLQNKDVMKALMRFVTKKIMLY